MRRRLKPIVVYSFLAIIGFILSLVAVLDISAQRRQLEIAKKAIPKVSQSKSQTSSSSTNSRDNELGLLPIVDVSGWQLPSEIDYDTLSSNISGAIVRVYGGSQITKDNNAAHTTGIDKSFKTHIEEFQKRDIPVAVYSYALGASEEEMREEARIFYKSASPYKPTYYWIDVEEETMSDMNAGVEAFRSELERLGAKHIGIYIGTYFMVEQDISVDKFDAVWLPTYGSDSGVYEVAPVTDIDYDLHQYTSQGSLPGFDKILDLNQINPDKKPHEVYEKLFGSEG